MTIDIEEMEKVLEKEEKQEQRKWRKIEESKRQMALALLKSGSSYREVAVALDMSVGSVHNIAKEPEREIGPLVEEIKNRLAMKYLLLADHILNRITDWNIKEASLKEKALTAAILTDKALLAGRAGQRGNVEQALNTPGKPEAIEIKEENGVSERQH